jgi:two-component system osmolarity sensor histidine kinase EnvZ
MKSPTLFWRTFLLIVLLLVAAVTAWLQSFRVFEREPRARQVSQQLISIVNITRAALLHSDPVRRRALLADLADNEGIRVVLREDDDRIVDVPDTPFPRRTTTLIREHLGDDTRVATQVNGVGGIWVSFDIDGDDYWVFAARDPLARDIGRQWIGWAAAALLLSLLVAVAITRVVNLPLARLSNAARAIGRGQAPSTLPDQGPPEIRTVNASFNRMVADLAKLEQDRAVLLAGISHDLRTPLTRLRLEIELNPLGEETRRAMLGDLEQMDSIVGQFLDYARPAPQQPATELDLSALAGDAAERVHAAHDEHVVVTTAIAPGVVLHGHAVDLRRALDNLITNALRYGRASDSEVLDLAIGLRLQGDEARLSVCDQGPGIPADAAERLLRPFERGDSARAGAAGAGLGLAIVERIARQHGGRLELAANAPRGLCATLVLPRRSP